MIQIKCGKCGKSYSLPDAAAGKKAKCKACDAVLAIPKADDPLGLGGDTGGGSADLSALYGGSSQEPVAPPPSATESVGFNPAVSFTNTPRRSTSGPPMKLILGGIGGLAALILIVGVVVVVFSGGDDDDKPQTAGPGLSAGAGGFTPDLSGVTNNPDRDTPSDNEEALTGPERFGAVAVEVPEETELGQWSFEMPEVAERLVEPRVFRGMVFHVPTDWEVESLSIADEMGDGGSDDLFADLFGESAKQVGVLGIKPKPDVTLTVMVTRRDEPRDWPETYRVDGIELEMMFGTQILEAFEEKAANGTDEEQFALGLMEGMMEAELQTSVGFAFAAPKQFYIHNEYADEPEFGTLFGGYRFLRVTGQGEDRKRMIFYAGYVGDLQVVAIAEAPRAWRAALADLDWVIRTAELATESQASAQAAEDEVFSGWLNGGNVSIPTAGDEPPLAGLEPVAWEAPSPSSLFANPLADMLIGPRGTPYAMIPPASLEVISKTRAAIRTKPGDDGFWASMEVHKLSGFERRQASPRSAGGRLLVRGNLIDVPDDAELSEITSDYFTIHRLLHPADRAGIRRVEYVIKDGAYLITVLGRFPEDQPERLEQLDEAAMTVQPFESEED